MYTIFIISLVFIVIGVLAMTAGVGDELGGFGLFIFIIGILILTHVSTAKYMHTKTLRDVYQNKIDLEEYAKDYTWDKPMIQQQQQQQEQTTPDSSSG